MTVVFSAAAEKAAGRRRDGATENQPMDAISHVLLAGLQTSFVAHWLQVNQVGPSFGEPGGLGFFPDDRADADDGTIFVMWLGEAELLSAELEMESLY